MLLLTRFRWLAALVLWLGPLLAAHATHIQGGDITYAPVAATTAGVPRYHVVVQLFCDYGPGITQQPIATLRCSRGGCDVAAAGGFTVSIPQSQPGATYALGCPGFPLLNYQVLRFETDVNLPAGQWTLSFTETNRQPNIANMTNSVNQSLYFSTYLDNSLVAQNTSPRFLSTLLPYLPNNQSQRYSFSAFDSEGDSLVYELSTPQQGFYPAGCGAPATGALPAPHFQLNAATGALTPLAAATSQRLYALAVRINEFRRVNGSWQLIGYVTRDIIYLANPISANQTPHFTSLKVNGSTTSQPLDQPIRVQPGQTVSLALGASDPDAGQSLRFTSEAPGIIPGLSLQTTGATSAQLTWQVPATLPLGRYTATVAVLDNGCATASEEYTFAFWVVAQPLASRAGLRSEAAAFPTPFREQVQFMTAPNQAVVLVDALGREVARLTSAADGRVLWQPAPALPAGLYLARSAATGQPLAHLLRAE
jgi:hypothetical protein